MVKTIKITTGNQISIVELLDWSLKEKAKAIGAEYLEVVNFPLKHPEAVKRLLMERFPSLWEV